MRSVSKHLLVLSVLLSAAGLSLPAQAQPDPPESAAPPRIEVAFALDTTGSMGSYIAEARARIREIADALQEGTPRPEVRFALVEFRDRTDAFITRVHPFTRDIDVMQRYLDGSRAEGGGDHPEAVLEGVRDTLTRLRWTPPSGDGGDVVRLLYLVGDAEPQHYDDSPSISWLTAEARRRHIVIHGLACSDSLRVQESFGQLSRHTEGRYFSLREQARSISGSRTAALTAALTETTRNYSAAVGVDFNAAASTTVAHTSLATPQVSHSGLLGGHVRWVNNLSAYTDLWAVHTSLMPEGERPAAPPIDFSTHLLLVVGGERAGLVVDEIRISPEGRAVRVRPSPERRAQFVLVPLESAATEGE